MNIEYKNYHIESYPFFFDGAITVQFDGDEAIFDSVDDAKKFIDEVTEL